MFLIYIVPRFIQKTLFYVFLFLVVVLMDIGRSCKSYDLITILLIIVDYLFALPLPLLNRSLSFLLDNLSFHQLF